MTSYAGKKIMYEHFSGTTDGSGDLSCSLSETPTSVDSVFVTTPTGEMFPEVQSLVTTTLKIRFYKKQYTKITAGTGDTDTDAIDLPGGISAASTKFNTGIDNGFWGVYGTGGTNLAHSTGTHGVSFQYTHSHGLTQTNTNTSNDPQTSASVSCIVMYSVDV